MADTRKSSGITAVVGTDLTQRLARLLDEAAELDATDARAVEVDREIVERLRDSISPEQVLGGLALDRLGALVDRCVARLSADRESAGLGDRQLTWEVLDLVRRPAVLTRVTEDDRVAWERRLLEAIEASHCCVGPLFRQRAAVYGPKVLFAVPERRGERNLSWHDVEARVDTLARGLLALDEPDGVQPVAILSENRPEMALLDLACLTSGLVDVMVPANATEQDVGYILQHARVRTVVVSTRAQLHKVQRNRESLPDLRRIVAMDPVGESGPDLLRFDDLRARAGKVPPDVARRRGEAVRIGDLATVMYTSGTTGTPKGIQFSHRNLVFKRHARGLALPRIGDQDVFLAYLPLFHTFGRYLEMLGSVYWGATYCFLLDPSVEALVDGMGHYRPTVFISVPQKWIQLYEMIVQHADPMEATDREMAEATRAVTGGRLSWGLSAAGHLDPEIFRFFQTQGVQVMSGFGMSEATGGITMTPPNQYRDGSLGVALPGIDLELGDDGELLIRGPYVMMGYLDPPDGEPSFDAEGWFHTGDLMRVDDHGHLRLVDRKKEIYKNIKGQTIAPQRIENLFREFESVGRAFLVGDHKPYNTLLIYPNPKYAELDFASMSEQDRRDHFRSLVVSVNRFVAPYERIVDFAVIDRDLDADRGELTPKGTPKRNTVVENFADTIASLYRRAELTVGGVTLALPNWLFQSLGLTAQDVHVDDERIVLPSLNTALVVRRVATGVVQIGSCRYETTRRVLDLGTFLATPRLWLGNEQLVEFAPLEMRRRDRARRGREDTRWLGRAAPFAPQEEDRERLETAARHSDWTLEDLDLAARFLASADERDAVDAIRLLEKVLSSEEGPLPEPARLILHRGAESEFPDIRRRAFQTSVPAEREVRFREMLDRFFAQDPGLLDSETSAFLCERSLTEPKVGAMIAFARDTCIGGDPSPESVALARSLLSFLAEYGAAHPARFRAIRAFLVRMSLFADQPEIRRHAADARETLEFGFRQWLGPTSKIAVDPETQQEYRWEDVVVFEEDTPDDTRRRLLTAIRNTQLLKEAVFLFYPGRMVRLEDAPPGGVWIRLLGSRHGKSVYRVTMQTRSQDTYDLAINVNESVLSDHVQEEIDWLILCGDPADGTPVVETFGGYYPDQDLWTEEFVSGETLDRELRRLARRSDQEENLGQLWPFLAWSALASYVDFWRRTGRRLEIAELSTTDVVLPTHDYHTGSRIVSLSARQEHRELLTMLRKFKSEFVDAVEREHERLEGLVGWNVVFSSILEVVGETAGLAAFEQALAAESDVGDELPAALRDYVVGVQGRGFLPMRLFFAVERFRRWRALNADATPLARARTLQELFDTYSLDRLATTYPETRLRFFRETVFRDATPELAGGLDDLIARMRARELKDAELVSAIADLRQRISVEEEDDYFLARVPFAHIRPEDAVQFVSTDFGGTAQSEIVVNLEDADGSPFRVRHALLPKEVERLHRLFVSARLDVRFRPEHRYLVAINEREQIIGGIYYEMEEEGEGGHLEKIVVADGYRRKGVADGLMHELFNRLRAAGATRVTTGFFRPEYFYSYGFRIEKRYAGLVKTLE